MTNLKTKTNAAGRFMKDLSALRDGLRFELDRLHCKAACDELEFLEIHRIEARVLALEDVLKKSASLELSVMRLNHNDSLSSSHALNSSWSDAS